MSKFYVPSRVNETVADEGIWFDFEDDAGINYGSFKCRFLDPFSDKIDVDKKRVWAKHGCNNNNKKQDDKRLRLTLSHLIITDWKLPTDPTDKNAKPVPFSPDSAFEYLSLDGTQHILVGLVQRVTNNAHFVGDETADLIDEKEEVEKN